MKTIFTLNMLMLICIAGIVSCRLFQKDHYNISALLTLSSIVAIIFSVYVLSSKRTIRF
jgi:hypothetical protein